MIDGFSEQSKERFLTADDRTPGNRVLFFPYRQRTDGGDLVKKAGLWLGDVYRKDLIMLHYVPDFDCELAAAENGCYLKPLSFAWAGLAVAWNTEDQPEVTMWPDILDDFSGLAQDQDITFTEELQQRFGVKIVDAS